MNEFQQTCEVVKDCLPQFVFEELDAVKTEQVQSHLVSCLACREQEANLRTLIRAVRRRDRHRRRTLRHRRRLRTLALVAAVATLVAGLLVWGDRQRQRESTRFAELRTELQLMSKQLLALSEAADQDQAANVEAAGPVAAAEAKPPAVVTAPPPPPGAPVGEVSETGVAAAASTIRLLGIGNADGEEAHEALAHDGGEGGEQLPYEYSELRSLLLAGVQPVAARVNPAAVIDHFGPKYRSNVESPLVLAMHAAPSPFEPRAIVVSAGVGHQPVPAATESNTDYTFVLAGSGSGTLQRTLRKALLPWVFDKLDASCRVSVVAAGVETATLLDHEPVRMSPDGQPVYARAPTLNSSMIYQVLREQRARLEKQRRGRQQHVMVLVSEEASLPGPEQAPWPEQLGEFAAPWLEFTVVHVGDGIRVSRPELAYLAELARQGDGRLVSLGTDVLNWEEKLLPRVASLSTAALHAVGAEVHFNSDLVAAFRPLHQASGWAQTSIGAADRWPTVARIGEGRSRTGIYVLTPQQGGMPDRVAEFRVRYDAGDAKFAAEERLGLQPEQISDDFFTAPRQLQIPVVAAELSDILLTPASPDRKARIATLRQVWKRLAPSLADAGDAHDELGGLIAALW